MFATLVTSWSVCLSGLGVAGLLVAAATRCVRGKGGPEDLRAERLLGPDAQILAHLPPRPQPGATLHAEMLFGAATVSTAGLFCLGLAHGMVAICARCSEAGLPALVRSAVLHSVGGGALLAVCFEAYLLAGDPGVIRRNPRNSLPPPPAAAAYACAMMAGGSPDGSVAEANLKSDDGRSYCVRCCVWRPSLLETTHGCALPCGPRLRLPAGCEHEAPRMSAHHCSTCAC